MVKIQLWPVQAGAIAENLYRSDLLFRRPLQSLQIFTRDKLPVPVTELENE